MLALLAPRATPGVEVVEGGTYRRSISLNGHHGYFEVSLEESDNALAVRIQFGDPRSLYLIIERIRGIFDLTADWPSIAAKLRIDPELLSRVEADPRLQVPRCWTGIELVTLASPGA